MKYNECVCKAVQDCKYVDTEEEIMADRKEKVIVIGGGIAGLTAGIYALKAGYEAEIFEKNPVVGGECMGWSRKGYHIDNSIHWLTGTDPKTGLWETWKTVGAIDENTEYADTSKFYSSRTGGREVTLWNDLDKTENIAGQWIMSPGGLPVALVSGKFAVQRILKKAGRSIII